MSPGVLGLLCELSFEERVVKPKNDLCTTRLDKNEGYCFVVELIDSTPST